CLRHVGRTVRSRWKKGIQPEEKIRKQAMNLKSRKVFQCGWMAKIRYLHMGEIFEKYEEETGIKVEYTEVGMTDQLEQLSLDAPAGQGPDLYQQPHDMIGSAYLQGLGMELDPEEFDLEAFNENAVEAFTYEGALMGVPFAVEAASLYYNKDIVDEAPETIEDLEAIMEEHTDEGNNEYGLLLEATNFYFAYPFLFSGDEQIFSQNEDATYNADDLQVANEGV